MKLGVSPDIQTGYLLLNLLMMMKISLLVVVLVIIKKKNQFLILLDKNIIFWDLRTGKSIGAIFGPKILGDSIDYKDKQVAIYI